MQNLSNMLSFLNPSSSKARTYLLYIVNTMGADVLATLGARASANMIFTVLNRIKSVPARWGLKSPITLCLVEHVGIFDNIELIFQYTRCVTFLSKRFAVVKWDLMLQ